MYFSLWKWNTFQYFIFYFSIFRSKYSIVLHFKINCSISFSKWLDSWNKIVFCILYCKIVFLHNSAYKDHIGTKSIFPGNSNIKSEIVLFIRIDVWKVDSYRRTILLKGNSYKRDPRYYYTIKTNIPKYEGLDYDAVARKRQFNIVCEKNPLYATSPRIGYKFTCVQVFLTHCSLAFSLPNRGRHRS